MLIYGRLITATALECMVITALQRLNIPTLILDVHCEVENPELVPVWECRRGGFRHGKFLSSCTKRFPLREIEAPMHAPEARLGIALNGRAYTAQYFREEDRYAKLLRGLQDIHEHHEQLVKQHGGSIQALPRILTAEQQAKKKAIAEAKKLPPSIGWGSHIGRQAAPGWLG